jgi:hypothetical protein
MEERLMALKNKNINFGKIDHFLFVRINCVCTDLGLTTKEFIENSYFSLVKHIDKYGETHFKVVQDRYKEYADFREHTRYAPRIREQEHSFGVQGVHEEIHKHLVVIKDENDFGWRDLLIILLMTLEAELDMIDAEEYHANTLTETVEKIFSDNKKFFFEEDSFGLEKTDLRRDWEKENQKYYSDLDFLPKE